MVMFAFNPHGVILIHHAGFGQRGENHPYEQAHITQEGSEVNKANTPVSAYASWHNHYKRIQPVADDDDDTSGNHKATVALGVTAHQNKHGENEVEDNHGEEGTFELTKSLHVVSNLFWNVGIPNQHEL